MFFASKDRYRYARSPLIEVICQLRFPAILSIGAKEPAQFQEAIRRDFPRYAVKTEQAPVKVVGAGTPNARVEQQAPVTNYHFISADGFWKINLTSTFIALSTLRYTRWEDFAHALDKPLAQFIQIYEPAFFERVGLRYINAFSRKVLGLEGTPWADLIQPAFLGPLAESDLEESTVSRCSLDLEMKPEENVRLKLHAGPGLLQGGKQDSEVKFILDSDLSCNGSFSPERIPERLECFHGYATRILRGALTSQLHTAMGPFPLD